MRLGGLRILRLGGAADDENPASPIINKEDTINYPWFGSL